MKDYSLTFPKAARHISEFKDGELWVCSLCGKRSKWSKGWIWYGSVLELDYEMIEAVLCPACGKDKKVDR